MCASAARPPARSAHRAGSAHRGTSPDMPWPRRLSSPEDRILASRSPSNPARLTDTTTGEGGRMDETEVGRIASWVGLDVGKEDHHATVISAAGERLFELAVSNDEAAIERAARSGSRVRTVCACDRPAGVDRVAGGPRRAPAWGAGRLRAGDGDAPRLGGVSQDLCRRERTGVACRYKREAIATSSWGRPWAVPARSGASPEGERSSASGTRRSRGRCLRGRRGAGSPSGWPMRRSMTRGCAGWSAS
jgi:hypothetical protein